MQAKIVKRTEFDLGARVTVQSIVDLAAAVKHMPPDTRVTINSGDSQRDGAWCKVTVADA